MNYIRCKEEYRSRFEELFGSRAHAIDRMPGFLNMAVLKPTEGGKYLILSFREHESVFKSWTRSAEFLEGHRRGFEDLEKAKEQGKELPMVSNFKAYRVISR